MNAATIRILAVALGLGGMGYDVTSLPAEASPIPALAPVLAQNEFPIVRLHPDNMAVINAAAADVHLIRAGVTAICGALIGVGLFGDRLPTAARKGKGVPE